MRGLLLRACFVRCARAGRCGSDNDPRIVAAQCLLNEAKASNDQSAVEKAATAVAVAKVACQKTSDLKGMGGRLATHM